MRLETERLILCPWSVADWEAFRPIATDPEVMRYITGGTPWTDERIQQFISNQTATFTQHGFCRWKLTVKGREGIAGFCGAGFWRDAPDPEIGWWIERSLWGQGFASEAAPVALRDIFERVRLKRVISVAMPENLASLRIMKKLGLRDEGEFVSEGMTLRRHALTLEEYLNRPA